MCVCYFNSSLPLLRLPPNRRSLKWPRCSWKCNNYINVWSSEKSGKLRLRKAMYWCICELATLSTKLVETLCPTGPFRCFFFNSKRAKWSFSFPIPPINIVLLFKLCLGNNILTPQLWMEGRGIRCGLSCSQQFCRLFYLQVLSDRRSWRDAQVHKDCKLLQLTVNTACFSPLPVTVTSCESQRTLCSGLKKSLLKWCQSVHN